MLRLRSEDEADSDAALKFCAMASAKKSEAQVSPDLRDEADRIDDLAHALARLAGAVQSTREVEQRIVHRILRNCLTKISNVDGLQSGYLQSDQRCPRGN